MLHHFNIAEKDAVERMRVILDNIDSEEQSTVMVLSRVIAREMQQMKLLVKQPPLESTPPTAASNEDDTR